MNRSTSTDQGFSLVEVFIAIALLSITAYLFATMSTHSRQATKAIKTIAVRDGTYFSVGQFAGDVSALYYTLSRTDVTANNCFRACIEGKADAVNACRSAPLVPTGSTGTAVCLAHGGVGTGTGTGVWHPFSIFHPTSGIIVAGRASTGTDPTPVRYSRSGEICPDPTQPNSMCPILAHAEIGFACPELRASCQQAASAIIRYRLSWTTDTSVKMEQASFKQLSGEVEVYRKQIVGDMGVFMGSSETEFFTGTGTGVGAVVSPNTNTQTCTTDTSTGTSTNSAIGAWVPFCV